MAEGAQVLAVNIPGFDIWLCYLATKGPLTFLDSVSPPTKWDYKGTHFIGVVIRIK